MQIYVHKNNQQLGPFTDDEIKAQLAAGTLTLQDHVWGQGQANWLPLGQTSLVTPGAAPLPGAPTPAAFVPGEIMPTSKLAIWSLVCGCLSLLCGAFAAVPAVILGHMSLSEIKKNPGLQGRGMAIAGTVIGYIFIALTILGFFILASLGNQVKDIFKTINSQMAAAQAAQSSNNSDESSTNSDQSTNAPDQTTPTAPTATPTNSPDQSTNSATATPPAMPDQSTNSDASTNTPTATPMQQ